MGMGKNTPEGVARGNQNFHPILNEPKADLGEVCALSDAVNADKSDTVWHPLLSGGQRRGEFRTDGKQEVGGSFRGEDTRDRCRQSRAKSGVRGCVISSVL